jgi:hypothetical protein
VVALQQRGGGGSDVMILPAMPFPLVHHNFVASRRGTPTRYSVVVKKDRSDQTRHSRLQRCRLRKNQGHSPLSSPESLYSNEERGWTSSPTLLYDLIPTDRLKHQLRADSPGANHSGSGIRRRTRRLGKSSRQGRKKRREKKHDDGMEEEEHTYKEGD